MKEQILKYRWGESKRHNALWFYFKTKTIRGMCWVRNKEELYSHFVTCEMQNIHYLEGLHLLEKLKGVKNEKGK